MGACLKVLYVCLMIQHYIIFPLGSEGHGGRQVSFPLFQFIITLIVCLCCYCSDLMVYSSVSLKEKLAQVQLHLEMERLKLTQEVEIRSNSTYLMLQHLVELREPVATGLAGLQKATVELSAEENMSASKVAPPRENAGANPSWSKLQSRDLQLH